MLEDLSPAARIAELEADNRRLRRLLDERDAPRALRHQLRGTLATLRAIIRWSAETGRDAESYVAHLEDRLDALMRAQAYADEYGAVDLQALIADELLQYKIPEGERALLAGPVVELQPKAAQILALAIHELAVNAVEHGALGAGAGRVEVSWSVAGTEHTLGLTLRWKEHGGESVAEPTRLGFGTEVLTRMLAYEFGAETSLAFEPDGLLCTISLILPA